MADARKKYVTKVLRILAALGLAAAATLLIARLAGATHFDPETVWPPAYKYEEGAPLVQESVGLALTIAGEQVPFEVLIDTKTRAVMFFAGADIPRLLVIALKRPTCTEYWLDLGAVNDDTKGTMKPLAEWGPPNWKLATNAPLDSCVKGV